MRARSPRPSCGSAAPARASSSAWPYRSMAATPPADPTIGTAGRGPLVLTKSVPWLDQQVRTACPGACTSPQTSSSREGRHRQMKISLGYQIPSFTYPGGPAAIFDTVVAQAQEAESSGFDTVLLLDPSY